MPIIQGILDTIGNANNQGGSVNPDIPRTGGDFSFQLAPDIDISQNSESPIREEAYQDGFYTDYIIRNIYQKDGHIYTTGTTKVNASTTGSTAFFKLCSSTLIWICDWTACRYTSQPNAPDPNPADSNWLLLDEFSELPTMTIGADNQNKLWRRTGTYIYGHKNPDSADLINLINYPRPPWIENNFSRTVSSSSFEANLSNATTTNNGQNTIQPNLTGSIVGAGS